MRTRSPGASPAAAYRPAAAAVRSASSAAVTWHPSGVSSVGLPGSAAQAAVHAPGSVRPSVRSTGPPTCATRTPYPRPRRPDRAYRIAPTGSRPPDRAHRIAPTGSRLPDGVVAEAALQQGERPVGPGPYPPGQPRPGPAGEDLAPHVPDECAVHA